MKKILFIIYVLAIFTSKSSHSQTPQLWGMTFKGGVNGYGNIFKMNLNGSGYTIVHSFNSSTGKYPCGILTKGPGSKLYGMTEYGGTNNYGVLFSVNPANNLYTVERNFTSNERWPRGNLLLATDGKLYGMIPYGGIYDDGIIFSFNPANGTFTKLFDFERSVTGGSPSNSLMQASNGLIYGMAHEGGSKNGGVLFSFNIINNTFNKLHSFNDSGTGPRYPLEH